MAAGPFVSYNHTAYRIGKGDIVPGVDTFKAILVLSTSNFETATLTQYSEITNEVATAFGYTQGGIAWSGVTWTQSTAKAILTAASAQWSASGGSIVARGVVVIKSGTAGGLTNAVVSHALLDATPADVTATAGQPFIVTPDATLGIFTMGPGTLS